MQTLPRPVVWAGITCAFVMSFAHLIVAPYAFEDATYKGLLFVAGAVCALIAATGIQEGHLVWGWGLASAVAGMAFAGFIASTTVGLPGLAAQPAAWREPLGMIALVAEGLMLGLVFWVAIASRLAVRRAARGALV